MSQRAVCTLGMFIIDEFEFRDVDGRLTGQSQPDAIGGGGTYCAIGARIWLPPYEVGMIVDRGHDFPASIQERLDSYGSDMWLFRDRTDGGRTLRALNAYVGESRRFEYKSSRIRPIPRDLEGTLFARPIYLHLVCVSERALSFLDQISAIEDWNPVVIFEPMEGFCTPEELPALKNVLGHIDVLSPNAEEALEFLSIPLPVTVAKVEEAAANFQQDVRSAVIIRSGAMGAYLLEIGETTGTWIGAFWTAKDLDKVVDVTGAGNSFLGGLAAGLAKSNGNMKDAMLYATVSASYAIEQSGLPIISQHGNAKEPELWNGSNPYDRLEDLRGRGTR